MEVISKNESRNMQMVVKDGVTSHIKIRPDEHCQPRLRKRMESGPVKAYWGYDPREVFEGEE